MPPSYGCSGMTSVLCSDRLLWVKLAPVCISGHSSLAARSFLLPEGHKWAGAEDQWRCVGQESRKPGWRDLKLRGSCRRGVLGRVEGAAEVTLEGPAKCLLCTNLLGCRELVMQAGRVVSSTWFHRHQLQGSGETRRPPTFLAWREERPEGQRDHLEGSLGRKWWGQGGQRDSLSDTGREKAGEHGERRLPRAHC